MVFFLGLICPKQGGVQVKITWLHPGGGWVITEKNSEKLSKSQKSQILLPTFSGIWFSGHFKPNLSKVGQEMAKFYNFEKKILKKNIFGVAGIPQNRKMWSNFEK